MALESERHSPNNASSPDPAGSCQCCQYGDNASPSPSPPSQNQPQADERVSLPFSVANILKPDFGRRAVISTRHQESLFSIRRTVTPICDYQRLYQPVPIPKPTKKLPAASPPVPSSSPPLSPASSTVSASSSTPDDKIISSDSSKGPQLWPAWVYCTRYSDRPSSGEFHYVFIYFLTFSFLFFSFLPNIQSESWYLTLHNYK